jgi:hypothetical protein
MKTPGGTTEPITSWSRPREMTNQSRIRGLATAGLLCAALAGCGTAVATSAPASTAPATTPPAPGAAGAPLAAASVAGCADVNQATSVTVVRHVLVVEPVTGGPRTYTQRRATLVRALFGDFCVALAHAVSLHPAIECPANFGTSYTGTFYDGQRVLATFIYVPTGCQELRLTASGQSRGTLLIGTAAAAAPHLKADLAAVLGLSESQVDGSPGSTIAPVKAGA